MYSSEKDASVICGVMEEPGKEDYRVDEEHGHDQVYDGWQLHDVNSDTVCICCLHPPQGDFYVSIMVV